MTLKPIKPEELAWSEIDGGISIQADAVAKRLNELLEKVEQLECLYLRHHPGAEGGHE